MAQQVEEGSAGNPKVASFDPRLLLVVESVEVSLSKAPHAELLPTSGPSSCGFDDGGVCECVQE